MTIKLLPEERIFTLPTRIVREPSFSLLLSGVAGKTRSQVCDKTFHP